MPQAFFIPPQPSQIKNQTKIEKSILFNFPSSSEKIDHNIKAGIDQVAERKPFYREREVLSNEPS